MNQKLEIHYQQFSEGELNTADTNLLQHAQNALQNAYEPYSNFKVGAAILLANGEIITGFNFENAAYSVTICAERTALSSAITQYPNQKIIAMAISYLSQSNQSHEPLFPCGVCRQFLVECEDRNEQDIKLILGGMHGDIIVAHNCKSILPFSFNKKALE
jgi:cytidine deaminase